MTFSLTFFNHLKCNLFIFSDELSPVIVFCPSDFHVVLTQDSPVAIITFEEPTAIDNSNQPLLIKRNPEDVSSPYVCESDKLVTFTFYDTGNNSVSCTFRVIVEGTDVSYFLFTLNFKVMHTQSSTTQCCSHLYII